MARARHCDYPARDWPVNAMITMLAALALTGGNIGQPAPEPILSGRLETCTQSSVDIVHG